ncbi:hypothetical protein BSLG_006697 [Batrachochytrium salamandrivorans]|nr:hypothetical protein BSLG_006697 [Batrachochytrium salamandrivorans]
MFGTYYAYDLPASLSTQLQHHLRASDTSYAWHQSLFYSAYSLPNIVLPLVGGLLTDMLGPHRLMLICAILVTVGQIAFSAGATARVYTLMHLGRFIFGVGGESLAVVQSHITAKWFKDRELAFALGVNLGFARLGSVFNDVVSPYLAAMIGVDGSIWFGTVTCLCSFFCALSLAEIDRTNLDVSRGSDSPYTNQNTCMGISADANVGTHPYRHVDQEEEEEEEEYVPTVGTEEIALVPLNQSRGSSMPCAASSPESLPVNTNLVWRMGQVSRNPLRFWLVCLIVCLLYATIVPFNTIHAAFLQSKWYPDNPAIAAQVMGIPDLLSAVLVPFVGSYVDYAGHRVKILIACSLSIMGVHFFFALAQASEWPSPIPALSVLGVSYAFLLTLWACIPQIVDEAHLATGFGIATSLLNGSLTLFSIGVAALVNADRTYFATEIFFAMCSGTGAVVCGVLLYVDSQYFAAVLEKPVVGGSGRS